MSTPIGRGHPLWWMCISLVVANASTAQFPALHGIDYRHIGPPGNRVTAVAGVPGTPSIYYLGAASGGIFRSVDAGVSWRPIFDDQPVASIGSLAVAGSDPNVIWVGTGEAFIRANVSIGNGVYRSTDGGETWRHLGLELSGRIPRILVHPDRPERALVAALGHCFGPQRERGVFLTVDGGASWQQTLFVNENTGAVDLASDPDDPRVVYAATWQMTMDTWSRTSGGPGSAIYRSHDGGETWRQIDESAGLPSPPYGRIGLATTAADSNRVYALIETSSNRDFEPTDQFAGVLWRSEDGGDSWAMTSTDNNLVQRPLYYSRAVVSPHDADEVHFLSVRHSKSLDGGHRAESLDTQPGWDHHDMWIDPVDPRRMIVGHDGGVAVSTNGGDSWLRPLLPIAQMYHVAVDRQIPYFVYGNRQDGKSARGPSNSLSTDEISIGDWRSVGGCEVGFTIPDPVEFDTVWSGCYDGILERHDLSSGLSRDVSVWPEAVEGWPAEELRYRFQWTYPIAISPHDHQRVYVGSQFVHQTTNAGQSWSIISPDLTSNDPLLQRRTGGLTLDDAGPTLGPSIFALAESPLAPGLVWVGTNDGRLQLTRDGGESWTDLSDRIPTVSRGTFSNIEPSPHSAGTCYLTVDRHQLADFAPYIYRTDDYGQSWSDISSNLPRGVLGFAHCVREDPIVKGLLYLGTESGVWVSSSRGDHWQSLRLGLPHVPIHWLAVQDQFRDLVVASYGRGFWILDDITPLQAADPGDLYGAGDSPRLLPPRPAYRFRLREPAMSQPNTQAVGTNPPYGATLHYFLPDRPDKHDRPEKLDKPDKLVIEIVTAGGEIVHTLTDLDTEPGLHRELWNLRMERSREVRLRTPPLERDADPLPESGWRRLTDGSRISVLAPPGMYEIRLRSNGEVAVQALEVKIDPTSTAFATELPQQNRVLADLRDLQDAVAMMINEIEWARLRIHRLRRLLGDRELGEIEKLDVISAQLRGLEGRFFDLRLSGARQDTLRWKRLLYAKLSHLASGIGQTDRQPTDQQLEVFELLKKAFDESQTLYQTLFWDTLPALDRDLAEAGFGPISTHPQELPP